MSKPYELAWPRMTGNKNEDILGILTGLSPAEIHAAAPANGIWRGQAFVKAARSLGFNCNGHFIPFDRDTEHPCIMRTTSFQKGFWYPWVYYENVVYTQTDAMQFAVWQKQFPRLRVTSMLQIWI